MVVKIVYYLKESFTCIFWAMVIFNWPSMTKKEPKMGRKRLIKTKLYILKLNMIFKFLKLLIC